LATLTNNNGAGLILAGAVSGQKNWVIANQYNVNGGLEFTQTTAAGGSTISSTPSMVLDSSGNLGIGTTTPTTKLHVSQSNAGNYASVILLSNSADAAADRTGIYGSSAPGNALPYRGGITFWPGAVGKMTFHTGNNAAPGDGQVMELSASGNLGLGVTPSAWGSGFKAMQIGAAGVLVGQASAKTVELVLNAFHDGSSWKYLTTDKATQYYQYDGAHAWGTAASGTAGNAITFTQAMTLDTSGNLGVGETSPSTFGKVVSRGGTFSLVADTASQRRLSFWSTANGNSENAYIQVQNDGLTTNTGEMLFATRNTSGTLAERARITSGGDLQIANGNLVMSTSGKGIDFAATAGPTNGTMTSELLNDYEEGTWTPTDQSGAGLTFTVDYATYTKVGRAVSIQGSITYPSTASGLTALFGGFPFTAANSIQMSVIYSDASVASFTYLSGNTSNVFPLIPGTNVTNATLSGKIVIFAGTYFV